MIAHCFYRTARDADRRKVRDTLKLGNLSRFEMTSLHVAGEERRLESGRGLVGSYASGCF